MPDLVSFVGFGPLLVVLSVVILALLASFVASRYKVAGANEALIVAGSRGAKVRTETGAKAVTPGSDRGIRVVVGGGTFVMPLIHKAGRLKLVARQIPVSLPDAVTSQGLKVKVEGVATFKIGRDVESIRLAAERFLDASDSQIDSIVRNILEGSLRAIVGTLTIEDLISDRQKLLQQVADAAKGDLATSGLEIDSFTIQSINDVASAGQVSYIEQLGAQKLAIVQRDAAIAKAQAEQQSAVASAEAEKIKIAARRDQALVQAEADVRTAAAMARAQQAEPLARAEATQEVRRKEAELAELQAQLREKELLTTVIKPAEAEAAAAAKKADGQKAAMIRVAEAQAEQVRLGGQANADRIRAQGEAEADALARRADAYREFNEAAILQAILSELPKIVAAAAQPLGQIDNLTVLSSDGATEVVRTGTRTVAEASAAIKGLTGIDLPVLIGGAVNRFNDDNGGNGGNRGGAGRRNGSGNGKAKGERNGTEEEAGAAPEATADAATGESAQATADAAAKPVPAQRATPSAAAPAAAQVASAAQAATAAAAATASPALIEAVQRVGSALKQLPGIERYRSVRLVNLLNRAGVTSRPTIEWALGQLPPEAHQYTVGDLLDQAG